MNAYRLLIVLFVVLAGCASTNEEVQEVVVDDEELPPAATHEESTCQTEDGEPCGNEVTKDPLLDRTQRTVYNLVNSTSKRVDSFFGATDVESEENVSRGRISAGYFWDERNGSKTRLRFKARIPMPKTRERGRVVFGRGNVDNFVDGSESDDVDTLPERFNDFEDDEWLLGVGYNRQGGIAKGWDFGVGVRLATPIEPYVRATYRWNRSFNDAWFWRVHPRVFWQNQRGVGGSLTNILDHAFSRNWLFRSWTILQGEDEIEGMGWTQRFFAYQALDNADAISYSIFATGETDNEVPLQNYGLELRYRRQVAREWFFITFSLKLDWPREFLIEERETNFGAGIEFEMQFGDWPGRKQELGGSPDVAAAVYGKY